MRVTRRKAVLLAVCLLLSISTLHWLNLYNSPVSISDSYRRLYRYVTQQVQDAGSLTLSTLLNTRKEFLYLVQAESCLPDYLSQPQLLGNTIECQCDVLVLSYRIRCTKLPNQKHVEYVFGPNTTWASGRNVLYRLSRERDIDYRYYIFADDDIKLVYNELAKTNTKEPELRTFERFLLEVEPAVGVVNYVVHHQASFIRAVREHCLNKPHLALLPMVHFDPILNGFHRDAISHVLPYVEDYDNTCWWHPHRFVSVAIEIKFRGQAVMFPGISVWNLSHRKYPRDNSDEERVWREAVKREKNLVPKQHQDHFIISQYSASPIEYSVGYSPTTCMEIVPHRDIKPYAHFDEFPMRDQKTLEDVFNMTSLAADVMANMSYFYHLTY